MLCPSEEPPPPAYTPEEGSEELLTPSWTAGRDQTALSTEHSANEKVHAL